MGRIVGVIHAARTTNTPFPETQLADLASLAKLAGARIGLLRTMSDNKLQATTDALPTQSGPVKSRVWGLLTPDERLLG